MRLHALTLEAFGPFPGREHIDFDALDHGILLVNGPTGSGKSSLLDAVTFALFGDVAGARRALKQSLRSHHAPPERQPSVELVFSVGPARWKIRRTPQWEAPKRRGTGTTTRHATVLLSRWQDGAWHVVSTRIDEAADMVTDTLGMGLDQFAQVVLLPQGEFAEFLRARPEDRRALLERLFDVQRFDAVERWLAEMKNDRVRSQDASLATIQGHLAIVADTLARLDSSELELPAWTSDDVPALPAQLRTLLAQVRRHRDAAQVTARTQSARASGAERALERAATLVQAQRTYVRTLAELDAWPPEEIERLQREIEAASAVESALKLAHRRDAAAAETERYDQRRQAAHNRIQELTAAASPGGPGSPSSPSSPGVAADSEVLPTEDDLAEHEARLNALATAALRLFEDLQTLAQAHQSWQKSHNALTASQSMVSAADKRLAEATARARERQNELDETPDPTSALEEVAAALKALPEGKQLATALAEAEQQRRTQLEQFVAAETTAVKLRTERLSGMAAELAGDLRPGEPCPVCGSAEHPAPTLATTDAPTAEQIEAAEADVRASDAQRIAAETRVASAHTAQGRFQQQLQADLDVISAGADARLEHHLDVRDLLDDPAPLHTLRDLYADAVTAHHEAARRVVAAEKDVAEATQARAGAEAQHTRAETREEAAKETVQAALSRANASVSAASPLYEGAGIALAPIPLLTMDDLSEVTRHVTAADDLTQACTAAQKKHRHLADAVREFTRLQEQADAAGQRLQMAEADLQDELVAKGYSDLDAARQDALDDDALAELRSTWQHGIETRAAASTALKDVSIRAAAMTPSPDESRLRHNAEVLTRRASHAQAEAASWERAYDVLASMRDKIADAVRAHVPLARAAHEIQELSSTFSGNGENTHRMRLTSYALAAHLESVTAMANERLHRMTDGRYQLLYTDERAKGTQRSGLGLLVVDAWTGRSRDTATLSGGEAFMASLALALGLGDAVRADSGGMELHTLFIDEGFGSLDQDTLEQVMEVLDSLREGGRLVGVVSHVSELRARIPTHIEVRKTSEGSHVHTTDSAQLTVSEPQ